MLRLPRRTLVAVFCVLASLLPAAGATARDICRTGAVWEYKECKLSCLDPLPARFEACLPLEAGCVEGCQADRGECEDAADLDARRRGCRDELADALALCSDLPLATREHELCVHRVQVEALRCRIGARRAVRPALIGCRLDFRSCVRTCEREVPGPALKSCRIDVQESFIGCLIGCNGDLQAAHQACLERDRACGNECHAERRSCEQDAELLVDAEQRFCDADRIEAIQDCRDFFGVGNEDFEACVGEARVDAFACREDLRLDLLDELEICREDSIACLDLCPTLVEDEGEEEEEHEEEE